MRWLHEGLVIAKAILVLLLVWLWCRLFSIYWSRPAALSRILRSLGFPILPYTPCVGNSLEIGRLQRTAYSSVLPSASDHKYLSRIWAFHFTKCSNFPGKSAIYWLGQRPSLNIVDGDHAKEVLSSNYKHYVKFPTAYIVVKRLLGRSILTVDGEDWEQRRHILNPAFSSDRLTAMAKEMSACAMDMVNSWTQRAQQSAGEFEIDVFRELLMVSGDIISRTSFGTNFKEGKAIFEDQETLTQATYQDFAKHSFFPVFRFLPTARNRLCWKLQKRVEKTLRGIVERRILAVREGETTSYGEDLLGRILATNSTCLTTTKAVLTTKQVMDECKTFFFAGHETTANLLTWAIMLMAVYPDWQERARAEVVETHGTEGYANPRSKLKTLEMILNETLRLYPPVPQLISRTRSRDSSPLRPSKMAEQKLGMMPHGVRLTVLLGVFHRDKRLWGGDADEFRPERFVNGVSGACKAAHGFMPFGLGPHTCIGQTFALLEAKLVLSFILQRFQFRLSPSYRHAPRLFATLRPQYGMPLILSSIQPNSLHQH